MTIELKHIFYAVALAVVANIIAIIIYEKYIRK